MPTTYAHTARQKNLLFVSLIAAAIAGCSTDRPPTDAFGREVAGDILIEPGPLRGCDKSNFDSPPKIRLAGRPLYPIGRLLENKEDIVDVVFVVDRQGRANLIEATSQVDKNRDSVWFRSHVELAMSKWQLDPATKGTQPAATTCRLQFVFRLE